MIVDTNRSALLIQTWMWYATCYYD